MSYYERIIQADFGFYSIDEAGFKIVSNHPYGHGMVITDFTYDVGSKELTFANNLAGTVTEPCENTTIEETLKRVWSDSPVELRWQVHPEWPTAGQGELIQSMLKMTWEEFVSR